jgi:hypothetical protein
MRKIERLRRVSGAEWRLMIEALRLLARIRVALWVHPFKRVQQRYARRTLRTTATAAPWPSEPAAARAIGIAVRRSSRLVPAATCLPQALATRVMLERRGIPNDLLIGVAKSDAGALEAHAWVEVGDEVVVGRLRDLSRFQRMPELPTDIG